MSRGDRTVRQSETHDRVQQPASAGGMMAVERSLQYLLLEELRTELQTKDADDSQLRSRVSERLSTLLDEADSPLSHEDRATVIESVTENVLGLGPLKQLLDDRGVEEILVNDHKSVYISRGARLYPSEHRFIDETHYQLVLARLLRRAEVDRHGSIVQGVLPDGSALTVVFPPTAPDGPSVLIRKRPADSYSVEDLIAFGTVGLRTVDFFKACVRGRLNILISGGPSAGKTTLLDVMCDFVPNDERIVAVERFPALRFHQEDVVRLIASPLGEGPDSGTSSECIIRAAAALRPDRVVIDDVVADEAFELLASLASGQDGALVSVQGPSPREALHRFETMALLGDRASDPLAVRRLLASVIDLVVHVARLRDGSRRVTHVAEVVSATDDRLEVRDIATIQPASLSATGSAEDVLSYTGHRPRLVDRLESMGIDLLPSLFERDET